MYMRKDFFLDFTVMQEKKLAKEGQAVTAMKALTPKLMQNGKLIILNTTTATTKEFPQRFVIRLWEMLSMQPKDQFIFPCANGGDKNLIYGPKMWAIHGEQQSTSKTLGILFSIIWKCKEGSPSMPNLVLGMILICWKLEMEECPTTNIKAILLCGLSSNLLFLSAVISTTFRRRACRF